MQKITFSEFESPLHICLYPEGLTKLINLQWKFQNYAQKFDKGVASHTNGYVSKCKI